MLLGFMTGEPSCCNNPAFGGGGMGGRGGGLSDFVCLNSLSFSCLVIIYCNAVGEDVDLEIFCGVPER